MSYEQVKMWASNGNNRQLEWKWPTLVWGLKYPSIPNTDLPQIILAIKNAVTFGVEHDFRHTEVSNTWANLSCLLALLLKWSLGEVGDKMNGNGVHNQAHNENSYYAYLRP